MKTEYQFNIKPHAFSQFTVDIIIPFHGQYHHVRNLIESILRRTATNKYKIYLVDNGSPNKSFLDDMRETPYVECIRFDENLGFGAALEAGFKAGSNPYVCLMNSDCTIEHPNWLLAMGESLLAMRPLGVKLVTARTDNPGIDSPALKSSKYDKGEDKVLDTAAPLYCCLCHRELFRRIGGFIKHYPLGGFEDEELFWRMKSYGFKQGVSGKSWVHHEGRATVDALIQTSPDLEQVMFEDNRSRCIDDLRRLRVA